MQRSHGISIEAAGSRSSQDRAATLVRALPRLAMTVAVAVLLLRAFAGIESRPITSDEALYLSEAVSIADGRIEYASGDPIVHRPPLYPAMLAPVMAVSGNDLDAARAVPIAFALGALAALFWLSALLFGREAAALAVTIVALAAVPSRLATGFFVDVPAAMWLLAAAAALVTAQRRDDLRWFTVAGALLGLSFLTKETAMLWLPLPVALALIDPPARPKHGIAAFGAAFAMLAAPWFVWVWWHTGSTFKVDAAVLAALVAMASALAVVASRAPWPRERTATLLAVVMVAGWGALMLIVLESRPEPHALDYWRSAPSWTARVFAPNAQPWLLIVPAWGWLAWRVVRGERGLAMPMLLATFGLPLFIYVANMGWEPRQVVWLLYLSYAVLAWAIADVTARLAARWRWGDVPRLAAACGVAAACALIATAGAGWQLNEPVDGAAANWRSDDEQAIAGWLRELPAGSVVLTSRLYSAQLYVDTDGTLPIRQLPTLGVRVDDGGTTRPFGTMFRYEDASTDFEARRTWIGLRAHADGAYDVALAEEDLLAAIQNTGARYVLLAGDDGGFSSLSYRPYFESSAAFSLLRADDDGDIRAYLYAIDQALLAPQSPPLMLSSEDLAPLLARPNAAEPAFWRALAPHGVLLDGQVLDAADMASLAD